MDMTDFFCDMEGHYFADKSKPFFKVFVKKELQIFRFLVEKIRLIFAGESNSLILILTGFNE